MSTITPGSASRPETPGGLPERKRKAQPDKAEESFGKTFRQETGAPPGTKRLSRYEKNAHELQAAVRQRSEAAVQRVLSKGFVSPSPGIVKEAIDQRLSAIAVRLLTSIKAPMLAQEWLALYAAALQTQDRLVLETLTSNIPPQLPVETMCELFRRSVKISTDATIALIHATPPEMFRSEFARDFLFGCLVRGDKRILQELALNKGIVVEALYPPRLEAIYAAQEAASRQIALRMIEKQRLSTSPLTAKVTESAQTVVLMPQEALVLKMSSEKAREDERLVMNLFHLAGARGIMSSARLKDLDPGRLGLREPQYEWSFHPQDFDRSRVERVASKLEESEQEEFLAAASKNNNSAPSSPGKKAFKELSKKSWSYYDGKMWHDLPFERFCDLYLLQKIDTKALVLAENKRVDLEAELLSDTPLSKAIDYRIRQRRSETCYLVPDIAGVENEYARVSSTSWRVIYKEPSGRRVERELSFRDLQKLYLEGLIDDESSISPAGSRAFSPIGSNQDLWNTLSLPWHVKTPLAGMPQLEEVTFTEVQAKPFVKGMKLVGDLEDNLRNKIFERLDTNSEINALLLTELQFYDLHGGNLGLIPKVTMENEPFQDRQFRMKGKTLSFQGVLEGYLTGAFQAKDVQRWPGLLQALESTQYEFVIFDIDINFAETNGVHFGRFDDGATGHFIPFRSCLLELPFKDRPLSQEALHFLASSTDRDQRMLDWLESKHAPIYQHMAPEDRQAVFDLVQQIASDPRYSLSRYENRVRNPDMTVGEARQLFIRDLSDYRGRQAREFWRSVSEALAKSMKPYIVQPGDTVASIAAHYGLSVEELYHQNPQAVKLTQGMQLQLRPNLTARNPRAKALREEIAAQVFPQATHFQIAAFKERIDLRNGYLQSVRELESEVTVDALREIIQRRSTPLSRTAKTSLLQRLDEVKTRGPLAELRAELKEAIKPTQFALMKATYPFLADVWEALLEVHNDLGKAARRVGRYTDSIEELIESLPPDRAQELQTALQEEIERAKIRESSGNAVTDPFF